MTEKIPPHCEQYSSGKNPDDYSDLLDELARIRKDIEQESLPTCHLTSLGQNHLKYQENSSLSNPVSEFSQDDKPLHTSSFRRLYRFDLEHLERKDSGCLDIGSENADFSKSLKNDTNIRFLDKKSLYVNEFEETDEQSKQFSRLSHSNNSEIQHNYYRYDDGPVLIPIRRSENRISKQNSEFVRDKARENHCRTRVDLDNTGDAIELTALPWGVISQYENESITNLAANAGNLSLIIGWGAIASGGVIFVRSIFVSSMIWLHYGLPVVALGAACLFLGIILSVLSEKMQHINDLKQSLTAHRILNPPSKKTDSPSMNQNENGEIEDTYDRLVKLRSKINELIEECENP